MTELPQTHGKRKSRGRCSTLVKFRGLILPLLILALLLTPTPLLAQDLPKSQSTPRSPATTSAPKVTPQTPNTAGPTQPLSQGAGSPDHETSATPPRKLDSLSQIAASLDDLSLAIKEQQKDLKSAGLVEREEGERRLGQLQDQRRDLRRDFVELLSGVRAEAIATQNEAESFEWDAELRALFTPLIKQLKEITEIPRELERLRVEINRIVRQQSLVGEALANIDRIESARPTDPLATWITEVKEEWQQRRSELQTQRQIAEERLRQKEQDRKSLPEVAREVVQLFLRSRGRNFMLALGAMMLFWIVTNALRMRIVSKTVRVSSSRFALQVRLLNIGLTAGSAIGAVAVFLLVLYLFGDWLLLTVACTLLLGVAWTSRQAITRFWSQLATLLNIGSVREGERIILDGLPWQIRSINFFSALTNPLLTGGEIRVPLRELLPLRSRPCDKHEPWFPTREGDWVLLKDEIFGRIVLQSPEVVRLTELGGAIHSIPTGDFLALAPRVLSTGFRVQVIFGLDYAQQSELNTKVLTTLKREVEQGLRANGLADNLNKLLVEVNDAGASSLNVAIIADFNGRVAEQYLHLRRLLQSLVITACTKNRWSIPYSQLTIHMADGGSSIGAAAS